MVRKKEKPRANGPTKKREVGGMGVGENVEKREAWGRLKGPRTAGGRWMQNLTLSPDRNLCYNVLFSLKPVVKFDSGIIQC